MFALCDSLGLYQSPNKLLGSELQRIRDEAFRLLFTVAPGAAGRFFFDLVRSDRHAGSILPFLGAKPDRLFWHWPGPLSGAPLLERNIVEQLGIMERVRDQ